jgi:hypothetical protein
MRNFFPSSSLPYLFIALSLLTGLATGAFGSTVTVGDPQHPADLPQAIEQAHAQGAADITITPGVYDLPPMHQSATILLKQWSDATIHAKDVTLIFEDVDHCPVLLADCTRVTWDGGTLLFVHPSYTQGRIKAISSDAQGDYCDWQIDAGYITDFDLAQGVFNVVDQKTRRLKVDTSDWFPDRRERLGPDSFRVHYRPGRGQKFAVNDWLVTRAPGGTSIVHLEGCHSCTMENVTLQNGGFAAFFETGGLGANAYTACKIEPGPRPSGATENQLVGCGADGLHSARTEQGPTITNCTFSGVFLDDCIAIHGTFYRVIQAEGTVVTLFARGPFPQVGDTLRIADMKGFFATAICKAVDIPPDQNPERLVRVTLDQDLHVPIDHSENSDKRKGTKADDPRYCGQGYLIKDCHLGNTRSRGILVKADSGTIEGCTIEGCGMSGVSIGPEFWWNESGYCSHVTVSENTFTECNKNNGDQAALWIHGDGAIGNRGIVVQGNTFKACYGQSVLRIDYTDGVQLSGNKISGSFQVELKSPGNVIALMQSKNVKLDGNIVTDQGPFAGDVVGLYAGMVPSEVTNDNPSGILVSKP